MRPQPSLPSQTQQGARVLKLAFVALTNTGTFFNGGANLSWRCLRINNRHETFFFLFCFFCFKLRRQNVRRIINQLNDDPKGAGVASALHYSTPLNPPHWRTFWSCAHLTQQSLVRIFATLNHVKERLSTAECVYGRPFSFSFSAGYVLFCTLSFCIWSSSSTTVFLVFFFLYQSCSLSAIFSERGVAAWKEVGNYVFQYIYSVS